MLKSLDRKLAAIHADPGCREFILADAKDADMALGLGAPGKSPETHAGEVRFKTLEEYREQMRLITRQALVDIMLMSASSSHALTIGERLFDDSPVTPAVRANDTTDIHLARGSVYAAEPSRPFRTASLDHIQCGHLDCAPEERNLGANLGLYSVTFNNNLQADLASLERFHQFREEAERKKFRYFLEVFRPQHRLGRRARRLAALHQRHDHPDARRRCPGGPAALPQDGLPWAEGHGRARQVRPAPGRRHPGRIVRHHPRRVSASGRRPEVWRPRGPLRRKINHAENQLAFVHFLRLIVDGQIGPVDAVKAYHAVLGKLGIAPHRPLDDDLKITDQSMSYSGKPSVAVAAQPATNGRPAAAAALPTIAPGRLARVPLPGCFDAGCDPGSAPARARRSPSRSRPLGPEATWNGSGRPPTNGSGASTNGRPDFARMSPADRLAYHRQRLGLGR